MSCSRSTGSTSRVSAAAPGSKLKGVRVPPFSSAHIGFNGKAGLFHFSDEVRRYKCSRVFF